MMPYELLVAAWEAVHASCRTADTNHTSIIRYMPSLPPSLLTATNTKEIPMHHKSLLDITHMPNTKWLSVYAE
jgi:hypothetical protein